MKKSTRKPTQSTSHGRRNVDGSMEVFVQHLPQVKEEIEYVIATKFAKLLANKTGRILGPLESGHDWPDIIASEGDGPIGIELVEVVDEMLARGQSVREALAHSVQARLEPSQALGGFWFELAQPNSAAPFPRSKREAMQEFTDATVSAIRTAERFLSQLPVGMRSLIAVVSSDQHCLVVKASRHSAPGTDSDVRVTFARPQRDPFTVGRDLLAKAVESKLNQRYGPFAGHTILLAYTLDLVNLLNGIEAAGSASHLFERFDHPFAEAWYIVSMAPPLEGALYPLWRRE